MSETASTTMAKTPQAGGAFHYAVTLTNTSLAPDLAIAVSGALIPVRDLLNGVTITQEADDVPCSHGELAEQDVLLAEGLTVESHLDTGNRHAVNARPAATAPAARSAMKQPDRSR